MESAGAGATVVVPAAAGSGPPGRVRRGRRRADRRQAQVLRGPDVAVERVADLGPALLDEGGRGREVAVLARGIAAATEDDHLDARRQGRQLAHEAGVDGHEERGQRRFDRAPGRRRVVVQRPAQQHVDAVAAGGQGAADGHVVDHAAVDQHVAVDR